MTILPHRQAAGRRFAIGTPAQRRPRAAPGAAAFLHLTMLGVVLAAGVFAAGGMIASVWTVCEMAAGLLLVSWSVFGAPSDQGGARNWVFPAVVLVLPLYAAMQAVPLPLGWVRVLSPVRAELHEGIAGLLPDTPRWASLSVAPQATLDFALRLGAYAAVYALVRGLAERFERNPFAIVAPVLWVAAAQAVLVLAQSFAGEPASGSYVNRNHVAGVLEMALPFAIVPSVGMGQSRGWRRLGSGVLAGSGGALIFSAILATRSRGGFLAALVSLLVFALALLRRGRARAGKWWAAAPVLILLTAAFIYMPSENLVRRYASVSGAEELRREGRVLLWRETLDLVRAYPVIGCGFGAFEPAFLRYKRSAPMVADPHAHNDYLELFAEAGALGFVLCLLLASRPVAAAVRASRQREPARHRALAVACLASLAAILTHAFVDFNLRIAANGMVFFWVSAICSALSDRGDSRAHSRAA